MAAKSTLRNMVLCLFGVCLFCSALLGAVYAVTCGPIGQARANSVMKSLSDVLPAVEGATVGPASTISRNGVEYEYYEQKSDSLTTAWAIKSVTNGFGGPLTVMVGVQPGGLVCAAKALSPINETPGLGAKCRTDKHFIDQFKGFDTSAKPLVVGQTIDAITASTITSKAYTLAVENAVAVARMLEEGISNE